ncbi:MAG: hypothetical protein JW953_19415 [Anaerolineae bacterium]|nr:hypothetical protein [Anaerolineae bacterium]
MEPATLILTALAAGAAAAAKDTASQAIKDGYHGLKSLVQKYFADKTAAQTALAEYEQDAATWEKPLQKSLAETGAAKDEAIIKQAQHLLTLVNPRQAAQGKYNVQIGQAKGVVIGDNASVTQNFGQDE